MNEDNAIAIMFANLKGSKKKPSNLLVWAEACRFLKIKWGSLKKVAEFFKVSHSIIQQIDRINELTPEVKKLVNKLRIDKSYQISRVSNTKQLEVAREVLSNDMKANPDTRLFIDFVLENPDISVQECKDRFLKLRPKAKKIHVLALPLSQETYDDLRKLASKSNMIVHDFALRVVEGYINEKKKKE